MINPNIKSVAGSVGVIFNKEMPVLSSDLNEMLYSDSNNNGDEGIAFDGSYDSTTKRYNISKIKYNVPYTITSDDKISKTIWLSGCIDIGSDIPFYVDTSKWADKNTITLKVDTTQGLVKMADGTTELYQYGISVNDSSNIIYTVVKETNNITDSVFGDCSQRLILDLHLTDTEVAGNTYQDIVKLTKNGDKLEINNYKEIGSGGGSSKIIEEINSKLNQNNGYIDSVSSYANLPTASQNYVNKKCIATDTNTIYKCILKDSTYIWQEDGGGMSFDILPIANGGTNKSTYESSTMTYEYRGIQIQNTIPTSITKGCIVLVY